MASINPTGRMPILASFFWLLATGSFFVFSTAFLSAQNTDEESSEPSRIANSLSPDGRKEITFRWASPKIEAAGNVYVHVLRTNEFSRPLPWSGFGYPYESLWRADGRAFTIKGEWARGYVVCKVYQLQRHGQYHLIETPDLVRCVADKYHLETYGKGGEHPVAWLPDNRLAIDVYDRSWGVKDGGDCEQPYRVTLQLPSRSASSPYTAVIQDIRPVDTAHDQHFPLQ